MMREWYKEVVKWKFGERAENSYKGLQENTSSYRILRVGNIGVRI